MAEELLIDIKFDEGAINRINVALDKTKTAIAAVKDEIDKEKAALDKLTPVDASYASQKQKIIDLEYKYAQQLKLQSALKNASAAATTQMTVATNGLVSANITAAQELNVTSTAIGAMGEVTEMSALEIANMTNKLNVMSATSKNAVVATNLYAQTGNEMRLNSKGTNALMLQTNQVLREMPNFAFSARIGLMSLTNNLPYLADAFKQVSMEGKSMIQILGTMMKSLFGIQGLFILVSVAMAAFTNPKFIKWFDSLFDSMDKVEKKFYELGDAQKIMDKAFKGGEYGKAIENVTRLKYSLEAAKGSTDKAAAALDDYNETLGPVIGEVDNLDAALQNIIDKEADYIEVMKNMALFQAYLKDYVAIQQELNRIEVATPEGLFNKEEEKDVLEKLNKEYRELEAEKKKVIELERLTAEAVADGATENVRAGRILIAKHKENIEIVEAGLKKQVEDRRDAYRKELTESGEFTKEQMDNYFKIYDELAGKSGIKTGEANKKTKTEFDELIRYFKAKQVELGDLNISFSSIIFPEGDLTERSNAFLDEEDKVIMEYSKKLKSGYRETEEDRLQFNLKIAEARETDTQNLIDKANKDYEIEKNRIQLEEKLKNSELVNLGKNILDEQDILQGSYDKKAVIENKILDLEKEKKKWTDKTSQAARDVLQLKINNAKDEEDLVDEDIKRQETDIEAKKKRIAEIEKELVTLEKSAVKNEELIDLIAKLRAELAGLSIDTTDAGTAVTDNWRDNMKKFAETMAELSDAFANLQQAEMDLINKKYDLQEKRIEDSLMSEEQKNAKLKQLEIQRYKELKKHFEAQKKFQIASVIISSATSIIKSFEGYSNLPFIGQALAIAQAATIAITAAAQIKKIQATTLEAPSTSTGGSSSGSSSTANVKALTPSQTNLISPQENLNQQNRTSTSWVKVSEINSVQNTVKVRETNQSF